MDTLHENQKNELSSIDRERKTLKNNIKTFNDNAINYLAEFDPNLWTVEKIQTIIPVLSNQDLNIENLQNKWNRLVKNIQQEKNKIADIIREADSISMKIKVSGTDFSWLKTEKMISDAISQRKHYLKTLKEECLNIAPKLNIILSNIKVYFI